MSGKIYYKGFDKDFKCRGFQYEVGGEYRHDGPVIKCATGGFHSCSMALDVLNYYPPGYSRYAEVELFGDIDEDGGDDSKVASSGIRIIRELSVREFISACHAQALDAPETKEELATGYGSASSATGYGSASLTTGTVSSSEILADGIACIAIAAGSQSKVRAPEGSAIVACYRDCDGNLLHVRAEIIGHGECKPNVWYSLDDSGKFIVAE